MRFLISAGEASGELYGAGLMQALRLRVPAPQFFGVGGKLMREAGFDTIVDAHDISVIGLAEVVTHLPMIRRAFKRVIREAEQRKPDAAILIDFPDFNLRLARELHKRQIPIIYYVSPQLWAWRQGRIRQIQKYVRKMLVIFPFEKEFYQGHQVDVEYVGHPLAEKSPPAITRAQYAAENKLDASKLWVALLPGSRRKEFSLNFGPMMESAGRLGTQYEFILPVANSLDRNWVLRQFAGYGGLRGVHVQLVEDAEPALLHSHAAIVASGTATLQTALIGTPFVMVYRVTPLTYLFGRPLVKVPYFAMPNLIAGREVVPEFVQRAFIPDNVAAKIEELMSEGPSRQRMIEGFSEIRSRLQIASNGTVSDRAASAILSSLARSKP